MPGADPALLAADPDLLPLWRAVHDRLCAGDRPERLNTVRVAGLQRPGVAALRTWLDATARRRHGRSAVTVTADAVTVPIRELLTVLDVSADLLPALVELALGQPIINRSAAARAAAARREALWDYAAQRLPQTPLLVARMRAAGVTDDDTPIRAIIDALAAVLPALPMKDPLPLAKVAYDATGDPHFFDLDTLAGSRLVAAVAELIGKPEPTRPDYVRGLLAGTGVIPDRLSATVLFLNVKTCGDGPIDRRLQEATTPVALTLLDLQHIPPRLAPQTLTVVENPSVLEFAFLRGLDVPLVCTSGQLRAIDHAFFELANRCGVTLRYTGDRDPAGLQIERAVAMLHNVGILTADLTVTGETVHRPDPVIYQEDDAFLDAIFSQDENFRGHPSTAPTGLEG